MGWGWGHSQQSPIPGQLYGEDIGPPAQGGTVAGGLTVLTVSGLGP